MALAQAALDFTRAAAFTAPEDRFGTEAPEILVASALMLGTCEGRALSMSKIADLSGLPRNTCQRRVDELVALGFVKRTSRGYVVTPEALSSEEGLGKVREMARIVLDAAAKLSEMDTKAVAGERVNK